MIDYTKPLETTCGKPVRLLSDEPLKGSGGFLPAAIIIDGDEYLATVHANEAALIAWHALGPRHFDLRNVPPVNEVLMQLFLDGPTWDGNLISKSDRDKLIQTGMARKWDGWNFLTEYGVQSAVREGLLAKDRTDKHWFKKAALR